MSDQNQDKAHGLLSKIKTLIVNPIIWITIFWPLEILIPIFPRFRSLIVDIVFCLHPIIWFFIFWPLTLLIKIFPQFDNYWFANFFSILANSVKGPNNPFKQRLFESLINDPILSCDPCLRHENKFRLLEIGVGPGVNLKYFPKNTSLIAIDSNAYFKKYFDDNLEEFHRNRSSSIPEDDNLDNERKPDNQKLTLEKFIICSAEDMKTIQDNSVDVIVATHLLCSVKKPQKVLSEIHRVLTPRGRYYMLEHVAHQERVNYFIQLLIKPFWSVFNDGCNLQSETLRVIKECQLFKGTDNITYEKLKVPFPFSPNICGVLFKG